MGLVNSYRQYIPRLAHKLAPLLLLRRKDVQFKLKQQHKDRVFEINECLLKATELSLKLPFLQKQLVIMCDATERAAGYNVFLFKNYTDDETGKTSKLVPVASCSKTITTR